MKKEKKQSSLSKILSYAGGYRHLITIGCILSGISAILGLVPYISIYMATRGILSAYPDFANAAGLTAWGWRAVIFAVLSIAVYFAALMMTHIAAFRVARNIRHAGMSKAISLPLGYFTDEQSGKQRKIIDDNAALTEDILAHKLADLTGAIVTPIAAICLLFVFDWVMGLLCLIPMILAMCSMMLMMGGKNKGFYHAYQREIEKMSGEAVEYVRGIPVVKVFQQTVYSFKAFYNAIISYKNLASNYAMSCRIGQTCFLTFINSAFALLIPAALIMAKSQNGWEILSYFIFYALFAPACGAMVNRIMYATESMMEADEAMMKLDVLMEEKPLAKCPAPKKLRGSRIEFEHVTFAYPGSEKNVLEDVSFTVEEGSTVALVGPSGGGKTTTATLIPRFYDVTAGEIRVGGINVKDADEADLMDKIAFVFQDTKLFKKSIADNVKAGCPSATREEVLSALHEAQCDDIIAKLPYGIDTVVGSAGVFLSGGEAERIALARSILKNAPIVLLDEATAFADPDNEVKIQKAFARLTKERTVLMIAHRLSTVQNADRIIVLADGRIAEQGSHSELIEKNGVYAAMWADYQKSASWKVGKEAAR